MVKFKSGYVGIVGRPNVGKSTLLNRLIGQKIAITSSKPQTTRTRITGILTKENYQVIFIDTPGLHTPKDQLHQLMMREIDDTVREVDLILFLVEANDNIDPESLQDVDFLKRSKKPSLLVVNKIDRNKDINISPFVEQYIQLAVFKESVLISALTGEGCEHLVEKIVSHMPEGPQYFSEDTITDRSERFIIAELIREKVYELFEQEIPYSVAVVTEEVKERSENMCYVKATIFVEKESQKGILIGNSGQALKKLGQTARPDIEELLQKNVYLELWVKVRKNWRKNSFDLREFGLEGKKR